MTNVWTVSGRCAADAEIRSTQSAEQVVSFRMANDVGWGDRKKTQWIEVSYWGKRAVAVAPYIKKGMKVTVSGELAHEEFIKRDGTPGSKLSLKANDVDLPARSEASSGGGEYDQSINSRQPASSGSQRGGGKSVPAFDMNDDF